MLNPVCPPLALSHWALQCSLLVCADTIESMMGGSTRNPYNIFLLGIGPMINASLIVAVFTGFGEKGAWGSWAKTLVESWKNNGIEVRQCRESQGVSDNLSWRQDHQQEIWGCFGHKPIDIGLSMYLVHFIAVVLQRYSQHLYLFH